MQKKILLSIIGILMLLLAGCDTFNTESKVTYASYTISGTNLADKLIKITVTLGNSVYIDSIDEVNATVNGTPYKLQFINSEINATNKVITVYAFKDSTGAAITKKSSNEIIITSIKCTDENDNSITVKGLELMGTVTLTESGSTGETTSKAVTGLDATVKSTSTGYEVTVTWTASDSVGTGGYKLYRMKAVDGNFVETGETMLTVTSGAAFTTSTESYTDKDIAAGNTYFYRVTAYDGTNETPKQTKPVSIKVTAATTTTITIPAVTGLTAVPDTDAILLAWAATSVSGANIIGYNIYGSDTLNGSYQKLTAETTSKTSVELATALSIKKGALFGTLTLSSGSPIFLKVKAVAEDGTEGSFSAGVKATMYDSTVPQLQSGTQLKLVPYGNTTSATETKLGAKLQWLNLTGVTEYIIERTETDGGTFSEIARLNVNDATYDANIADTNYTAFIDGSFMELKNKTAYYRIRCIKSGAIGRPSGVVTVKDEKEPDAPSITAKATYLLLDPSIRVDVTSYKTIADSTKYFNTTTGVATFIFQYLNIDEMKAATVLMPTDYAGYKIYMSNKYDGEFTYVGNVSGLWGATMQIQNSTGLVVNGTKPIYVRVSVYDYFGNESNLSLRSEDILTTHLN